MLISHSDEVYYSVSVRYRAEDEINDLAEIRIAGILHSHMNRDAEKLRMNSIRDITEPKHFKLYI